MGARAVSHRPLSIDAAAPAARWRSSLRAAARDVAIDERERGNDDDECDACIVGAGADVYGDCEEFTRGRRRRWSVRAREAMRCERRVKGRV